MRSTIEFQIDCKKNDMGFIGILKIFNNDKYLYTVNSEIIRPCKIDALNDANIIIDQLIAQNELN